MRTWRSRLRNGPARGLEGSVLPLSKRPRRGHIGFQELSEPGEQLLYRNARIAVLDQDRRPFSLSWEVIGPGFARSGIDAGESIRRNWMRRGAPLWRQRRIEAGSVPPTGTATPYALPDPYLRPARVGKQSTHRRYSDSRLVLRPVRLSARECGNEPLARSGSVPSTGVPSQPGEWRRLFRGRLFIYRRYDRRIWSMRALLSEDSEE